MTRAFILLQRLLPQHLLSRLVGWVANSRVYLVKRTFISLVIAIYKVDTSEAQRSDPRDYISFNDFFTRALKPGARPINGSVCSPADGAVSMVGHLSGNQLIQAKGISYSVEKLLAGEGPHNFEGGSFATIYLAPRDYHRVHVPVTGHLTKARYVPGKLFSVNQATAENIPDLFADNERLVTWFDTDRGALCVIMVGAMIVAGIKAVWRGQTYPARLDETETFDPSRLFEQGAELGHFEMGSTAIILSSRNLDWCVKPGDIVRMGQSLVQ